MRLNTEKAAVLGLPDGNCMLALVFDSGTFPWSFDACPTAHVVVENNPRKDGVLCQVHLVGFQVC